jgi:hypothetical protein
MDFEELQERLMPLLHELLAIRLAYSRSWNNVETKVSKRKLKVKWFSPKNPTDKQKKGFMNKEVFPFNPDTLFDECKEQYRKQYKEAKVAEYGEPDAK